MIGGLADVTARNAEFGDVVERWLGSRAGEGSRQFLKPLPAAWGSCRS